jgi:MHS family proline/betaine transporter-like MFS transporter
MNEVAAAAAFAPGRTHRRAIAAAAVGNAFEWYDFAVYVLFAPYIAQAFFPSESSTAALVKSFLAFGVGFIARPVGAVFLGYFGDYAGRKAALTLTFALMACGTLTIAVAPTHEAIGMAAPILILLGRLLQGLSAGGEIGGAVSFLVEHAPPGRKARYAAWLQASMAISNIIGALVALAVKAALPETALAAWGWRLPFVFGLLIVPVGLWLRSTLGETPEFLAARSARPKRAPVMTALRQQTANIGRGFGLSVLSGVCAYALIIYMPVHMHNALGFTVQQAFIAALIGNLVLVAMCFVSGGIADRFGRKQLMLGSILGLMCLSPALMALLVRFHTMPVLIFVSASFCALFGSYSGAFPAALAGLFPTDIRSTGVSIAYNGAITLFAGFAPAVVAWLTANGLGPQAPTLYVSLAALAALAAISTIPAEKAME